MALSIRSRIPWARSGANVETAVIKVPAGFQDYYSALYGSVSCVHFRADGIEREALNVNVDEIERRV